MGGLLDRTVRDCSASELACELGRRLRLSNGERRVELIFVDGELVRWFLHSGSMARSELDRVEAGVYFLGPPAT